MQETERTLGEHGARLTSVEEDIHEMKADIKTILGHVNQAKGGWLVILAVGSIGATIGGIIVTFIAKWIR